MATLPATRPNRRQHSLFDRLIGEVDVVVKTLTNKGLQPSRRNPAEGHSEGLESEHEKRNVAGLMRVNHAGEVCAQALYQGQALTAKLPTVRYEMQQAAQEEVDHLVWCKERLDELNSHTSVLNPVWYGLSFGLGALAGAAGDKWSLGFVAATEERVCRHLKEHLKQLPERDRKSRLILQTMVEDEQRHGETAMQAGGAELPASIKNAMTAVANVMTKSSYYL
jgi:ubiquinone biosynthesis monooxygenase Coq7